MHKDERLPSTSTEKQGFSRRDFIKVSSIGMLTTGFLTSCSDSDNENDVIQTPEPGPVPPDGTVSPESFPQSVAAGDPRPDSLIFWTRALNPSAPGEAHTVTFSLALDEYFTNVLMQTEVTAQPEYDNVIKLKVMQLDPSTTYYYRFTYASGGNLLASKIGRAKTAPTPSSNTPIKFAFISCQDYGGRYYNTLARLVQLGDLDFVLHLGDYIYETTGDPEFQSPDDQRPVTFSDPDSALDLGDFLAARSLSNYRDLYKTFRSDPMLQAVHERYAMISIWDDHEFSDDSWKVSGTYRDGIESESDITRKQNAERAWAEFMPSEYGINAAGDLTISEENLYPSTTIYRDFRFGSHLHLMVTDYRTFRPDHLIPEDAFPGTVVFDQPTLEAVFAAQGIPFAAVQGNFFPYVDIDLPQLAPYKQVLTGVATQQYMQAGLDPLSAQAKAAEVIQGNLATFVANAMIQAYNDTDPQQPLPLLEEAGLPVGFAWFMLGKQGVFAGSGLGSRYFVVKEAYDLYSGILYQMSQGQSENVWGADQETWLRTGLTNSDATWKVIGNSCSHTSLVLDFTQVPGLPATLAQRFYINVDQWDGFPNKRAEFLGFLAANGVQNTVFLAGDIHASHAAQHGNGVHEFTVAAVSSGTFKEFVRRQIQNPPFNTVLSAPALAENLEQLFLNGSPRIEVLGEPQMVYTKQDVNGFAVVEVNAGNFVTTFHHIDEAQTFINHYQNPALSAMFSARTFEIVNGELRDRFSP